MAKVTKVSWTLVQVTKSLHGYLTSHKVNWAVGWLHCSNLTCLYEQQDLGISKILCLALGLSFPICKSKVVRRTMWGVH